MSWIPTILTQHAEEAAFHWLLRDGAVGAPHRSLQDLAKLDIRMDAHIDGLRISGDPGWEICKEALASEEPGAVFTAGVLALESAKKGRVEAALEVGSQNVELCRGAISALGWVTMEQAVPHINALLESPEPLGQRIGIAASAILRRDPGQHLVAAISADPVVRARALRAAGELSRTDLVRTCRDHFKSEYPDCRFWAAWSAALLGDAESTDVLREVAEACGPLAERACDVAARRLGHNAALSLQKHLASRPESRRLAIIAAGAVGDPFLVPWLIEMMQTDELARPAGEAFSSITGIDLAYEDLEGEWPKGFEAGPTENPEDQDVAMDADENLPWPAPKPIEKWWSVNGKQFSSGTRYLLGKPMTPESLAEALRSGKQRQRRAAALELALARSDQPLFEVRARGDLQETMLAESGSSHR